jgi:hypothetical protein
MMLCCAVVREQERNTKETRKKHDSASQDWEGRAKFTVFSPKEKKIGTRLATIASSLLVAKNPSRHLLEGTAKKKQRDQQKKSLITSNIG